MNGTNGNSVKRYTFTCSFDVPRENGSAHRVNGRIIIDADNERNAHTSLRQIVAAHFPLTSAAQWQRKI